MFKMPKLLENPTLKEFNLTETEVYLIKEVVELINIEKYTYSLFAIWNCVITNIQRRIEEFGIDNFLERLEKKDSFNKEGTSLKDRWLNINEYQMLNYAKDLNIIDHISHNLIRTLFWMKSNTNDEIHTIIDKDEIYSITFLLEKHLFLKPFKQDMRKNTPSQNNTNQNRRKKDQEIIHNASLINKHFIEEGVNAFKKESTNTLDEEEHIIDKYC